MRYISFDPYYPVEQVNKFMEQYENNGFSYKKNMLISIKPPYNRYIVVPNNHVPMFIKYYEASSTELFFMVHQLIPLYPKEEFMLQRRAADNEMSIARFIEPNIFKELKQKSYGIVFRWTNSQDLQKITTQLKNKVWLLGTVRGSWKLGFSFDKGVKSFITTDQIILEKLSKSDYSRPGEFEVKLNQILLTEKLSNKVMEYAHWDSGKFYPLPRPIPNI